ncbi:MAG: sigma-54-dependent Fis family transcriptional regulator [Candidatus Delongbacteria bacterium]|nr:sigma-54-dependent Fis family transcriptional regulator [Candidatus Delongbacteria bacterium]MBN2835340.1 sigma-54-dependent Fis family transcriptional regulator [Candidatus Delongbacteria bacterium]
MDKLLIVDDNFEIISSLRIILNKKYDLTFASDVSTAKLKLNSTMFDTALLDVDLPDGSGLEILDWIKTNSKSTDVIMMSGVATANDAFKAVKKGAYDFIDKPISEDKLFIALNNLSERRRLIKYAEQKSGVNFLTSNSGVKNLLAETEKIAESSLNVLITGESGTGKEILAEFIHSKSKRALKPFVKVNCAAIPDTLFESEFFGHKQGAFTGAFKDKKGKFELANYGTIFLDEIGELPMNQQTKLLRVLEDNEFSMLGSEKSIKVDVRVISATNRDLHKMIIDGTFREDLFYRINVVNFHLPELSERKEDIPLLANFFLSKISESENLPEKIISDDGQEYLTTLNFKGNIRELKNLINKIFFVTSGSIITKDDLVLITKSFSKNLYTDSDEFSLFEETMPFNIMKRELEKKYIYTQLKKHEFNVSATALSLKMLPNNLFRKIKDLGISI